MASFVRNVLNKLPSKRSTTADIKSASAARLECPFADPSKDITAMETDAASCPFHAHRPLPDPEIQGGIAFVVQNSTFITTTHSSGLLQDIGGGDTIRQLCTRFYARGFLDSQLKPFFFEEDGATAHGQRLADWIIEKMGGEGKPWSESGRFGMRQPSHYKAWNCEKRDVSVRGDHFNLKDSRTWIRIHFWAARECGLDKHAAFWTWYMDFLGHFIKIYEFKAAAFVPVDAEWSADPANIAAYLRNGNSMTDL